MRKSTGKKRIIALLLACIINCGAFASAPAYVSAIRSTDETEQIPLNIPEPDENTTVWKGSIVLEEDTVIDGSLCIGCSENFYKTGYPDTAFLSSVDLNGHTLTVNGHFFHTNGCVKLNGGTLSVSGSCIMEPDSSISKYLYDGNEYCYASLIMDNEKDAFSIGKDLILGDTAPNDGSLFSGFNLTDGTLKVKGNISAPDSDAFVSSDSNCIVLDGKIRQDILCGSKIKNMKISYADSRYVSFAGSFSAENVIVEGTGNLHILSSGETNIDLLVLEKGAELKLSGKWNTTGSIKSVVSDNAETISVSGTTLSALKTGTSVITIEDADGNYAKMNVMVAGSALGDIDGDGSVNPVDATMILLQYTSAASGKADILDEEQKSRADVNGDSSINPVDATLVLRCYTYMASGGELSAAEYFQTM